MFKRGYTPQTLNDNDVRFTFNENYKIVVPIIENGSFRGYAKRRTDGEDSVRKYLYNDGFKPKIIQGNYKKDWVVITEGYMDWLKLKQNVINIKTSSSYLLASFVVTNTVILYFLESVPPFITNLITDVSIS